MDLHRRTFLAGAAAGAAIASVSRAARAADAEKPVTLALMGANNRGSSLAPMFVAQPDARIAYVCDVDERAIEKGIAAVTAAGGPAPKGVKDFRTALDDPAVDALIVAAPNHWHAAATILACKAGKHVYCEKPCSHTGEEGEAMIRAARDAGKVVQVGMQRRSGALYQRMVERVRGGALGEPLFARSWYFNNRPSIGHAEPAAPPAWLDYALWQGPAPEEPYRANILPYNWHWFWHWGNAELGNNGVHTIDICRWALGVDFPSKVSASGSRLRFEDDQQTPDTASAYFECDGKAIVWEAVSWTAPLKEDDAIGMEIRGTEASLAINDAGCTIYDLKRKVAERFTGERGDVEHVRNFLDAVHGKAKPAADIAEGHKSALFCHLGNIAYRCGETLSVDSSNGHVQGSAAAEKLWGREYRPGWELDELGSEG